MRDLSSEWAAGREAMWVRETTTARRRSGTYKWQPKLPTLKSHHCCACCLRIVLNRQRAQARSNSSKFSPKTRNTRASSTERCLDSVSARAMVLPPAIPFPKPPCLAGRNFQPRRTTAGFFHARLGVIINVPGICVSRRCPLFAPAPTRGCWLLRVEPAIARPRHSPPIPPRPARPW